MVFSYKGEPNVNSGSKIQGKLDDATVTVFIVSREIIINNGEQVNGEHPEVVKFAIVNPKGVAGRPIMGLLQRKKRTIECVSGTYWQAREVVTILAGKTAIA